MRRCTSRSNLVGQRAGTLVAKEYIGNSQWRCICDVCRNEVIITTDRFHKLDRLGMNGCKHQLPVNIGEVYGFLTVIKRADDYVKPKTGRHEKQWLCRCVCGREKVILQSNLKANKSMTCGLCSTRVSIPEKATLFYLKKIFDDVRENYRPVFLDGKEIDIFIPEIKLGVEYDGGRWHSEVAKDIEKDRKCDENNVRIIRIREPDCPLLDGSIITPKAIMNGNHMTEPIKQLLGIIENDYHIKTSIDVNCCRDNAEICKFLVDGTDSKSLAELYPDIAKEWDYEKNYPLTPDRVAAHAGKKAYWICPKGHSYPAEIASRTGKRPSGCPFCADFGPGLFKNGEYIGEHSLAKERPDIAAEFMEEKNGISADKVAVSSNKPMWFKCSKCEHEWPSKVNNRTSSNNQGCPKCAREKQVMTRLKSDVASKGSLFEMYPDICKYWDAKSNTLTPKDVHPGCKMLINWKCPMCGYTWGSKVYSMVRSKRKGCPKCIRRIAPNARAVINIDTGEVFSSIDGAAKSCNLVCGERIGKVCKGQADTAGGYHWKYKD